MTDMRTDADVVEMAAGVVSTVEEVHALATARGWAVDAQAQMVALAAGALRGALETEARDRPSRHVAHERRGDWVTTRSGHRFYVLDPRPDEFELLDLAHGLAKRDRWNGILSRHYSVGEHSARVGALARHLAREFDVDPELADVYGKLHDANEGILPDIPRPIKALIREWPAVEARVQQAILERFRLWPVPREVEEVVTMADDLLLIIEYRDPDLMTAEARATLDYHRAIQAIDEARLTEDALAAARSLGCWEMGWESGRGWLLSELHRIERWAADRADKAAKEAESATPGRSEWLREATPPTVPADAFEPPPHLKHLLGDGE